MTIANQIAFSLMTSLAIAAAYFDFKTEKIPNRLLYSSIVIGWLFWLIAGLIAFQPEAGSDATKWSPFFNSLIGFASAFFPAALIFFFAVGLNGGDVKLFGAYGAWLGSPQTVMDLAFYALLFSFFAAIIVMIKEKKTKDTFIYIWNAIMMKAAKVDPELKKKEDQTNIPLAITMVPAAVFTGMQQFLNIELPWAHYL